MAITATVASGADSATADLGPYNFTKVYVNNQAGGEISLQCSTDNSSFYELNTGDGADAVATFTTLSIGSAYSGSWVPVPASFRYIKAVVTGTVANGGEVYFNVVHHQ